MLTLPRVVGEDPESGEEITALNGRYGPYLKKGVPQDPWGRVYQYRSPGSKADYEILSLGKDGQPGGTGDNADISSQ